MNLLERRTDIVRNIKEKQRKNVEINTMTFIILKNGNIKENI